MGIFATRKLSSGGDNEKNGQVRMEERKEKRGEQIPTVTTVREERKREEGEG